MKQTAKMHLLKLSINYYGCLILRVLPGSQTQLTVITDTLIL